MMSGEDGAATANQGNSNKRQRGEMEGEGAMEEDDEGTETLAGVFNKLSEAWKSSATKNEIPAYDLPDC